MQFSWLLETKHTILSAGFHDIYTHIFRYRYILNIYRYSYLNISPYKPSKLNRFSIRIHPYQIQLYIYIYLSISINKLYFWGSGHDSGTSPGLTKPASPFTGAGSRCGSTGRGGGPLGFYIYIYRYIYIFIYRYI